MLIGFDNIIDNVIPMDKFSLKWRFTEEKHNQLPGLHLDQLKPLDSEASEFLSKYIAGANLHDDIPFKRNFFRNIESIKILEGKDSDVKNWLYQRGIAFDKGVFLSWDSKTSMIVPWKLLIKYFDDFYYSGSDDLTIIDQSLDWALLFFHYDQVYFGTNKDFKLDNLPDDIDFLW